MSHDLDCSALSPEARAFIEGQAERMFVRDGDIWRLKETR
jgi:hypothetical protein